MIKKAILLSLIFMFILCQAKRDVPDPSKSLIEVDRKFLQLSMKMETDEAFYRFLDEEGMVLPRQGNPIKGKDSYRKFTCQLQDTGRTSRLEWEPEWAEISQSRDLGSTFGRYARTVTDSAGMTEWTYGFCVTIWKKQADGSWNFIFDTGNEIPSYAKMPESHPH